MQDMRPVKTLLKAEDQSPPPRIPHHSDRRAVGVRLDTGGDAQRIQAIPL